MNSKTRDVDGYLEDHNGKSYGYDNDGYQLGLNYKNGGFAATANYQMLADSNRSSLWNVGVSYSWDTIKLEALYQYTKDKGMVDNYRGPRGVNIGNNNVLGLYNSTKEQQALMIAHKTVPQVFSLVLLISSKILFRI